MILIRGDSVRQKDLISVILPVYNSEKYLEDVINSVLNQSIQNFELIIVNDGSVDGTGVICEQMKTRSNKIKYFAISNHGVSYARNYALKRAMGTYLTFIDSDDLYDKYYLQTLLENIKKYNSEIIACAYRTSNDKTINYPCDLINCNLKDYVEKLQPNLLLNQLWNKMYITSIIKEHNLLFDVNINLGEDYKFNLEYLSLITKMTYINVILYQYRITNTGLGFSYNKNNNHIKIELLKKLENIYYNNHYEFNYIYKSYIIQYFSYFSSIMDKNNRDSKKKKKENIKDFITSTEYRNNLNKIKKDGNIKYKLIAIILLIKWVNVMRLLGYMANRYDKYKKRKKL